MTVLPIVARELRVASRRRSHYRGLMIVAAVTLGAGTTVYWANRFEPPSQLGVVLFLTLSTIILFSCLLSGARFTADALSSEYRDGTLGLLFLTDLRGHDVVLGKLTAAAFPAVFALLAALPVLSAAVLFGGVTGTAVWRMGLSLLVATGFTLALGMAVSVWFHDARTALIVTGAVTAYLSVTPWFAPAWMFGGTVAGWSFGVYVSPIGPYVAAAADLLTPVGGPGPFGWGLGLFWPSLAGVLALAMALLAVASLAVQHSWHEQAGLWRSGWSSRVSRWKLGGAGRQAAWRTRMLDDNPYAWVLLRRRGTGAGMWCSLAALGAAAAYGVIEWGIGWVQEGGNWGVSLAAHLAVRCGLTLVVVHQLGEDQRSGALELLLVTPLGGPSVVNGQMQAMRRLFGGPIAVVLLADVVFTFLEARDVFSTPVLGISFALCRGLMLVADCIALTWLGTWFALRAGSNLRASSAALGRVLVLPWFLLLGLLTAVHLVGWESRISDEMALGTWFLVGIVNSAYWTVAARRKLSVQFRTAAAR